MIGKLILIGLMAVMIIGTVIFALVYDGMLCPRCHKKMNQGPDDYKTGDVNFICPRCGYKMTLTNPDLREINENTK